MRMESTPQTADGFKSQIAMMNRILTRNSIIFPGILLLAACTNNDGYDYAGIEPGKTEVSGPSKIYTGYDYDFFARARGGSSYEFTVVEGLFTITGTDDPYRVIVRSDSDVNTIGRIAALETTWAGKVGIPDTMTFEISLFCELDINQFTGEYHCDEEGYAVYPVNLIKDPEHANRILNDNFWDYPAPGSTIYYELSGTFGQIVTVPHQPFTFGNGFVGWVEGSGTYDGCAGTMIVDYTVFNDGEEQATHHEFYK